MVTRLLLMEKKDPRPMKMPSGLEKNCTDGFMETLKQSGRRFVAKGKRRRKLELLLCLPVTYTYIHIRIPRVVALFTYNIYTYIHIHIPRVVALFICNSNISK